MGSFSKFLVVCAVAAGASVAVLIARRYLREQRQTRDATKFVEEISLVCSTSREILLQIGEDMRQEMISGLRGAPGSCLKMLPSYVDNLPDGAERGIFYALDLGGTNFRVLRVQLLGKEKRVGLSEFTSGTITRELMTGSKEDLFDMMATKLADFVRTESEDFHLKGQRRRELGFTFSFPCDQTAINSGKLIRWTKGFSIADTEGEDVVRILEEAMQRQNLDMKVTALVNDAVGTLAGARYYDPDVVIGVILGTGSNACYDEKDDMSARMIGPPPESGHMVINMEWGNFYSPRLPITSYDAALNAASPNPGEQRLEKLVSGMYLGEIVRLVLVDLELQTGIFKSEQHMKLFTCHSLSTPHISKIHADHSAKLATVAQIVVDTLEIKNPTYFQRKTVQDVVKIVASRGARLVAACLVGVLKKIGRNNGAQRTVIAVDGGLYENYTEYRETLLKALEELLGKTASASIELVLSKDGSGIGAALLAASHSDYNWRVKSTGGRAFSVSEREQT